MAIWDALRGSMYPVGGVTVPLFRDICVSGIFFLFHSQLVLGLIENVYMAEMIELSLQYNILAFLSILSPLVFLFFLIPSVSSSVLVVTARVRLAAGLLTLFLRVLSFWLPTSSAKLVLLALGVGCFWVYLPATFNSITKKSAKRASLIMGLGLCLASLLSILFRTVDNTRDVSALPGAYNVIGLSLAIIAAIALVSSYNKHMSKETLKEFDMLSPEWQRKHSHPCIIFLRTFGLTTALVLLLMTMYIVFESPAVLSRWTGGSYLFVILLISLVIDIFLTALVIIPRAILRVNRPALFLWNLLFSFMLIFTIVSQRVHFPSEPNSPAVEVIPVMRAPQYLVLSMNIILHPVLFVDLMIITKHLAKLRPSNVVLGSSFVLSNIVGLVVLAMHLFTNVWGYVQPVSGWFRNGYYLPFVFICLFLLFLVGVIDGKWLVRCLSGKRKKDKDDYRSAKSKDITSGFTTDVPTDLDVDYEVGLERSYDEFPPDLDSSEANLTFLPKRRVTTHWSKKAKGLLIVLFLGITIGTIVSCVLSEPHPPIITERPTTLTIMQYNLQQGVVGNNGTVSRVVDDQLRVIRSVNPDIIGFEECDSTRVFFNNLDIVRYFANKLQYHSFYGPKTTSGTFGVCVLSRFPISDPVVIYTYSDKDEVATVRATIDVPNYANLTVFVNHPYGSNAAMLAQTKDVMSRVEKLLNTTEKVISIGDFNYDSYSEYYRITTANLVDPWFIQWPTGIDRNGTDYRTSVDHIFLDPYWRDSVEEAVFIPTSESFSDHPAHYVKISL